MRTLALAIDVDDLMLPAELVAPDQPRALVILCHGLPSATRPAPDDAGYAGLARSFAAHGYATVWFNFRGCRGAPGDFSVSAWARDLSAVIDGARARSDLSELPLVVTGSSLGGAVALAVAAQRPDVDRVATLAAPASLDDLLPDPRTFIHEARNRGMFRDPGFPADPDAWAAEFELVNAERTIGSVAPRAVLIVHGDADQDVPYVHAERLFAAALDPKELVRLPNAGHRLRLDPRAPDAVIDWLDRAGERSRT